MWQESTSYSLRISTRSCSAYIFYSSFYLFFILQKNKWIAKIKLENFFNTKFWYVSTSDFTHKFYIFLHISVKSNDANLPILTFFQNYRADRTKYYFQISTSTISYFVWKQNNCRGELFEYKWKSLIKNLWKT